MSTIKRAIAAAVSLHMLAWLAMLLTFAGIMFFAVGVFWLIATPLGAGFAALIVGGGLLILIALAATCALLVSRRQRAERRRRNAARVTDQEIEERLKPVIGERATAWTKNNPGLAMAGALAAGVAMASSSSLRRGFYDAVEPLVAREILRILDHLSDDR